MGLVKTVILLGKPCSGKGTQARLLAQIMGFKVFQIGEKFREIARSGNCCIAKQVRARINRGQLLPFWFASILFVKELLALSSKKEGIIFDGVGRTMAEAIIFHRLAQWLGRPYKVFVLHVSNEEIFRRLDKRREKEGRLDDRYEIMKERLGNYPKEILGINLFRRYKLVVDIDADQKPEYVNQEILNYLD